MSFSATGTPKSGPGAAPADRARSSSAARASAPARSTSRKARTFPSTRSIRSRKALVTSTGESSPAAVSSRIRAAESFQASTPLALDDPGDPEEPVRAIGRVREGFAGFQGGLRLVRPQAIAQREGVGGRLDPLGRQRRKTLAVAEDPGDVDEGPGLFRRREIEPGEGGQVLQGGSVQRVVPTRRRSIQVLVKTRIVETPDKLSTDFSLAGAFSPFLHCQPFPAPGALPGVRPGSRRRRNAADTAVIESALWSTPTRCSWDPKTRP